ncbi:MAG: formate dehydrogenase accessory protein FdhE [Terriglobales bacterium]
MIRSKWDQRIHRADELAAAHPFAAEVLQFYKRIAGLQKSLYGQFEAALDRGAPKRTSRLRDQELNLPLLLPRLPKFLAEVETFATPPFVEAARRLRTAGEGRWREALGSAWQTATDPTSADANALLAWIFLQPYAEQLANGNEQVAGSAALAICPFCSAKPVVGVLRPEGDGGKRSLICSLCSTEWPFGRILCAACGEENVEKLAVYTASQFPHVRVEACDTCRRYIKTVDLTKNGHAVPLVDELATIPLNLWAEEHEYTKLQHNLLGI